jgi:hypothetical protein
MDDMNIGGLADSGSTSSAPLDSYESQVERPALELCMAFSVPKSRCEACEIVDMNSKYIIVFLLVLNCFVICCRHKSDISGAGRQQKLGQPT